MDTIDQLEEVEVPPEHEDGCGGLFWRATENEYLSSHKSIESKKSLRLLKRMSCTGCAKCDWMWDFIREDLSCTDGQLNHIEAGKIYEYQVSSYFDYESGMQEVDGSEFVEVKSIKE